MYIRTWEKANMADVFSLLLDAKVVTSFCAYIYILTNRFLSQSLLNRDLGEQRRTTIPNTGHFVVFCFACDFRSLP